MAAHLHALLLRAVAATRERAEAIGAPLVPLAPHTGLSLLPLTDEVVERIDAAGVPVPGFYELTAGLAEWARSLPADGPVAYVHLEFHGGAGFHAAVVWRAGAADWGPVFTATTAGEAEDHYEVAPADMAINRCLRHLGVRPGDDVDEFTAAGLGRHRWTDDWTAG